jgi:hypothetical protein
MRTYLSPALALALILAVPAFAQHDGQKHEEPKHEQRAETPRANGGHVPPAPERRTESAAAREPHRFEDGRSSDRPHVSNNHWYGHDAPNDRRFHLDHPFEHGHFEHFGPSYRYRVVRVDVHAHRFWFPGGFYFEVAPWDWAQCAEWCWNCGGDDFVVYDDPDHIGWYMLYNVHTGIYVHVQFLGH